MKIGVFCSANNHIDPDFFAATQQLGAWMASQGHALVFGGCNIGLMECIGQAVKSHGGLVIGAVPTLVEKGGKKFADLDVEIRCDNLSDRKDILVAQSDVILALPGGVGTLDEIFTVVASHTIGYHQKRVILYNMKGFWDSLIALLDDMQQRGMVRGSWHDYISVAHSIDEIATLCAD